MGKTDVFTKEDFGGIVAALYSYMHGGNLIADYAYYHIWDYCKHATAIPEDEAAQLMFLRLMRDVEEIYAWWEKLRTEYNLPTRAEIDAKELKEMYEAQRDISGN